MITTNPISLVDNTSETRPIQSRMRAARTFGLRLWARCVSLGVLLGANSDHNDTRGARPVHSPRSSSETRNARSNDWRPLSRGSHIVS